MGRCTCYIYIYIYIYNAYGYKISGILFIQQIVLYLTFIETYKYKNVNSSTDKIILLRGSVNCFQVDNHLKVDKEKERCMRMIIKRFKSSQYFLICFDKDT